MVSPRCALHLYTEVQQLLCWLLDPLLPPSVIGNSIPRSNAADSHAQIQSLLCYLLSRLDPVMRQQVAQFVINEILLDKLPAA